MAVNGEVCGEVGGGAETVSGALSAGVAVLKRGETAVGSDVRVGEGCSTAVDMLGARLVSVGLLVECCVGGVGWLAADCVGACSDEEMGDSAGDETEGRLGVPCPGVAGGCKLSKPGA